MNYIYNNQISKGKKIVLTLIVIINIYYWINFFIGLDIKNNDVLLKQISAVATVVAITFLFYRGFKIAKWLTVMLLVQPVMIFIFYPLHFIGVLEVYDGWLMLILAILIGVFGAVLAGKTSSIDEFMEYQRSKRQWFR